MKCVITGALGHIGSSLIRKLPLFFDNPHIVMIDNLSTQRYSSLFNLPSQATYEFIENDVQKIFWQEILKNIDVVIHLSGTTDAAGTVGKSDFLFHNNFESTKIIAQACLKSNVSLIFPSSTSVYGSQDTVVDEACLELKPQSPYASCKLQEEAYLQKMHREEKLKVVIFRLGTIYGISQGMRFHTAVNKFCWQAVMKQPITVWETALHQCRPYLFLDDAIQAFIWVIKKSLYDGEIYNIVTENHTVKEVLSAIEKHIDSMTIEYVNHVIMNQLSYEISSEKFKKTKFAFSGSLQQGIDDTIKILRHT